MNKYINNVRLDKEVVRKKYNKNVIDVYEYLDTVNFINKPKIISHDENEIVYEYIESKKYHEKVKGNDFVILLSLLHNKTLFYKDVSKNKYKNIYDTLNGNINYLKIYYTDLIDKIEEETFMSPSHYLFARNYSIINNSLNIASSLLNKWYKMVENKTNERVVLVHNNLSLKHFIKSDIDYFISFDGALFDTPILDLYKFYKNEGYSLNFKYLFKIYNDNMNLLTEEIYLFYILILMVPKIEFISDEYINTIYIKNIFNYISYSLSIYNEKST